MRRGRHEFRLTVWTFVAPVALVAAVLVVINIAQDVIDDRSNVEATLQSATARPAGGTTSQGAEGTSTAGGQQERRFYVIEAGDTLSAIAARFDTTEERLQELNEDIDPLALRPGQRIRIS
jgi:LysM repeat protein